MIIEVEQRLVCGVKRFYPVSHDAKALCKILNKKTLDKTHLKICQEAGWIVTYNLNKDKHDNPTKSA